MDERNGVYEALTVMDGRVQYVGSEDVARKLCDKQTEIDDFGNCFIYSGMVEGHCHPDLAGQRLAFHSDYPVSATVSIPKTVYTAVMRKNPKDSGESVINGEIVYSEK